MSENCTHNCSSCGEDCSSRKPESLLAPMNQASDVKKVIAVVSGKGGVGKSLVTSLMAANMQRAGYKTAVLDADITGPSIPKMFGMDEMRADAGDNGIIPIQAENGTKVMSVNLLLDDNTAPVVWRGPVISGVVKQFWSDVAWGDVDYMFVDMPPGTGDVPLTVFQSLPISGIIIVTSPQELVSMIVEKAANMAKLMHVPVLGIVENMSYFECPSCHERHSIFGQSHIEQIAAKYDIDTISRLPIDPAIAQACDFGNAASIKGDWLENMVETIKNA
jgi:Mrp family chromosome partitioning ATPase